jgi:hypothetical protein
MLTLPNPFKQSGFNIQQRHKNLLNGEMFFYCRPYLLEAPQEVWQ